MLSRNRGNNFLELKERPSRFEEGVSLCRKELLFTSKKRPFRLQTVVFTPLSIRRGVGGEASLWLEKGVSLILEYYYLYSRLALLCKLIVVITPLSIRRGDGGEASSLIGEGRFVNSRKLSSLFLFSITLQTNSSIHAPSYYFAGVKMSWHAFQS